MNEQQRARLEVVKRYHAYIAALRATNLDDAAEDVQQTRRALAYAIECGCSVDPNLLSDFKRAFTARPYG